MGRKRNKLLPGQFCAGCHFFAYRLPLSDEEHPVNSTERNECSNGSILWTVGPPPRNVRCHMGVWELSNDDPRFERELKVALQTDRRGQCFYWEYQDYMLFEGARVLQEREAGYRVARRDRLLTIWGLGIAAVALVVTTVFQILIYFKPLAA